MKHKHEWGRGEYGAKCLYCEAVDPSLLPPSLRPCGDGEQGETLRDLLAKRTKLIDDVAYYGHGNVAIDRINSQIVDLVVAIEAYRPTGQDLNCEEIGILHGQQVTVTFKDSKDAFDFFNELEARASLAHKEGTERA